MKIFIAYSGYRSEYIAEALKILLEKIFQTNETENVAFFLSSSDIKAGDHWREILRDALLTASCGILCLTKRNYNNNWIAFEAGALSQAGKNIFPYLTDVDCKISESPFGDLQARIANKEQTRALIKEIAIIHNINSDWKSEFEQLWPEFQHCLKSAPKEKTQREHNHLDVEGLNNLLEIHFQATVDRLMHDLHDIVERGEEMSDQATVDQLPYEVMATILRGRKLLGVFSAEKIGMVGEYLKLELPIEKIRESLLDCLSQVKNTPDSGERRNKIYRYIVTQQAKLKLKINEELENPPKYLT